MLISYEVINKIYDKKSYEILYEYHTFWLLFL